MDLKEIRVLVELLQANGFFTQEVTVKDIATPELEAEIKGEG
ncbi:hypothetical protein LCGC14_2058920 [marine sediment metagenome]|uniref:Uncharacterized protein n=1 Tax=marine sediment metagenome TaxID=412755 RepID=A0A0F9F948_9ZZZZ